MNIKELREEIRDLGFEENETMSEYKDIFFSSINRAITTISETVRAKIQEVRIMHVGCKNLVSEPDIAFDRTHSVTVSGNTYCFWCFDKGTYSINGDVHQLNSETGFYEGEIDGESVFLWNVEGLGQVQGFSVYRAKNRPAQPHYENVRYNLSNFMPKGTKFGGIHKKRAKFTSLQGQNVSPDIELEYGFIEVPRDIEGVISLNCKVLPAILDKSVPEERELPLDDDLHVLVPLLSSYYIWLDDDERKATIYYNEYDSLKSQIMMNNNPKPTCYIGGGFR